MTKAGGALSDADYAALAEFRYALRRFLSFSEARAVEAGLTPQQHQALLAIRGAPPGEATVGYVAERLILKPHSATGLLNRLESLGMISRETADADRRRALLRLTAKAHRILEALSVAHRAEIRNMRPALAEILSSID